MLSSCGAINVSVLLHYTFSSHGRIFQYQLPWLSADDICYRKFCLTMSYFDLLLDLPPMFIASDILLATIDISSFRVLLLAVFYMPAICLVSKFYLNLFNLIYLSVGISHIPSFWHYHLLYLSPVPILVCYKISGWLLSNCLSGWRCPTWSSPFCSLRFSDESLTQS